MMRRWRIRAAERPARRQANPPSPTRKTVAPSGAAVFSFCPADKKIERARSVPTRYRLFLYFFFFCASSPRGAARFFFPTGRKTHRCGWLDRLGRGSIEIAVHAQKAYRFSEQAYNITRFLLCQEYFNRNLVKMN